MKENIMLNDIGEGRVVLLAGGGKYFTDIAAMFVGSSKSLDEIIASEYDKRLVTNIIESGHLTCTEFDNFIFGIECYSRVSEVQLVRKRNASYIISSGRGEKKGKRVSQYSVPKRVLDIPFKINLDPKRLYINDISACEYFKNNVKCSYDMKGEDILDIVEAFYNAGLESNIPEEELRYMKPQATSFKAIISMNAHGLLDWFKIRCCKKAQTEIRDMAYKMLRLCKEASPDIFAEAGASCVSLGYCPENRLQHKDCKGKIITHREVKSLLNKNNLVIDMTPRQSSRWDMDITLDELIKYNETCIINRNFKVCSDAYGGICIFLKHPKNGPDNYVKIGIFEDGFTYLADTSSNSIKDMEEISIDKALKEMIMRQQLMLSIY